MMYLASLEYNFYFKPSQPSIELSFLFQTVVVHSICVAGNLCSVLGVISFKSGVFYFANQGYGSGSGGSDSFSVEAEARKFYRFRFHLGYLT